MILTFTKPLRINFFPLVLPLFPVLSFFIYNASIVSLSSAAVSLLIPVIGMLILWAGLRRVVTDKNKADLVTAVLGILFFTFKHFQTAVYIVLILVNGSTFDAIEKYSMTSHHMDVQRNFLIGWSIFIIFIMVALIATRANLKPVVKLLNIISLLIIVVLLASWLSNIITSRKSSQYESSWDGMIASLDTGSIQCPADPPDIFYILPDTYTNNNILSSVFKYDNSEFTTFLKENGFIIIKDGRSNYAQTPLSIASSLNYMHLTDMAKQVGEDSRSRVPLQEMIQNSKITALLQSCGYQIVAFSSGFGSTDLKDADIYLKPEQEISDFQTELMNLTPIPTFMSVFSIDNRYQLHRERILYIFDNLIEIRKQGDGPYFVFAHLTAPHHPFVFDEQGNPVNPQRSFTLSEDFKGEGQQEYISGYVAQLTYINKLLRNVLPDLIEQDPEGTVIILQGDHGSSATLNWDHPDSSGMQERLSILNAYYLPDQYKETFPEVISPVNTFRVILNDYFKAGLPLLENASYFSTLNAPFRFQVVP